MSSRPRRSIVRPDYRSLANISVPRPSYCTSRGKVNSSDSDKLYRLTVVEEDEANGMVKVRYIGYSREYEEWRSKEDIVELNVEDESSFDEQDGHDESNTIPAAPFSTNHQSLKQFCLYDELASRIKSLLLSHRKGDPICRINMSFDTIYFDGLIRRSKALSTPQRSKTQPTYTLPTLSELDDILGSRWYIRGINAAGDFCFVTPGTVKFHLKQKRKKIDFQMQADGTLSKIMFDEGRQLVFQFVVMALVHSGIKL